MRISELSRAARVSIPTLKYYLREGLLPPGRRTTAPNQAEYSEEHLRRLYLIRTLAEIGGLRLRDIRAVLDAVDDDRLPIHELLGVAHHALGPPESEEDRSPVVAQSRAEVDRFLAEQGWRVSADAPARRALARALATLRLMGRDGDPKVLEPYARAADQLAAREVATVEEQTRAQAVEQVVIGTVVFEAAFVALRRLAQEHHSALRFSPGRGRRRFSTRP